ncbi:MAG: epoxyqueuosine reductase QueH [Clostridia bacterium]|nr:epoxyqueuosine reductase QueH [Clostridia bacterium]
MSNKENYQLSLERTLCSLEGLENKKSLLLHACCAPCSSYVLEYLSKYFDITLFFYNPNIYPEEEFRFREDELRRLIGEMPLPSGVNIISGRYDPSEFFDIARGYEELPEGDERCRRCYALRLEESARAAKEGGFDYFCTTLSISPYKNAEWLNTIGKEMSEKYGVGYLFSDFKKKNGYKRSCQLSEQYSLYRQDYCGCVFSKREAEKRRLASK